MKLKERDFKDLVWPSFADAMVLNLSIFVFMFILLSIIMVFTVKDVTKNKEKFSKEKEKLETKIKELQKFETEQNNFVLGVENDLKNQGFNVTRSGNKLDIPAEILFKPGEATIPSAKEKEIKKIFQSIKDQFTKTKDVKLMIGGHSDDTPINNEVYQDNWSLSSDRARNVVRKFIDFGFPKNSIFASGFADTISPYQKPKNISNIKEIVKWRDASRRITIEIHQD